METVTTDLDDLGRRFRACKLHRDEWTHTAHLQVGAWHIEQFGIDQAIVELRAGIKQLNTALGTPNTASGGFHETITVAYARLIAEFLALRPALMSFNECVQRITRSALGSSQFLLNYYSRELLLSPAARITWVEPDLAPLKLPDDIFTSHLARERAAAVPASADVTSLKRSCRFCQ